MLDRTLVVETERTGTGTALVEKTKVLPKVLMQAFGFRS